MATGAERQTPDHSGRWHWRIRISGAVQLWESLWRALWPAVAIAGFFLALALFDVFVFIPNWLHVLSLAGFGLALMAVLWREVRGLRMPDYASARRRLEQVNELPHRPLEALDDTVVGGADADPVASALWQRHQKNMREAIAGLRVGPPRPRVIRRDPFALRIALALGLILGFLAAGAEAPTRIANAFAPKSAATVTAPSLTLDAWVTPPAYTGHPPVFLAGAGQGVGHVSAGEDPIEVPQGSVLTAQVGGTARAPTIVVDGGERDDLFEPVAQESFRAKVPLEETGTVAVTLGGREMDAWHVNVTPDRAPTVAFLREPGATPLSALRIDFEAHDDYGLAQVTATIRRPDSPAGGDDVITFELPLPGLNAKDAAGTGYEDLTPHPWAGLPVQIQLVARDGRGQRGVSGAITTVLPERVFNHPVARQIIAERKRLTAEPVAARHSVGANLRTIAWKGEDYEHDVTVFLALTMASQRLKYGSSADTVPAVQQLLWDTALRLEDGRLSLASRELRELQQALMEALNGDISDEELQRLIDELQEALNELLDALAQQQPPDMEGVMPDPNTMMLSREDLQALFDRIRELAQSGAKDAARQLLAELQNMLENLQAGQMGQMSPQFQQGMEMLETLQDLMQAQEELLDRTYREAQRQGQEGQQGQQGQGQQGERGQEGQEGQQGQGQQGQQGQGQQGQQGQGQQGQQGRGRQGQGQSGDVTLQEALRRQLGEIMRQLGEMTGEIPRPLGRAEGAMRRSTDALRNGQPGAAVPPQTEALDQLREGARMATEQMMQQFGGGMQAQGSIGRRPGNQLGQQDPFGRRTDGARGFTQGDVEIPGESDIQRARRILEELRRRAGERERPPVERDYIERLLKPF